MKKHTMSQVGISIRNRVYRYMKGGVISGDKRREKKAYMLCKRSDESKVTVRREVIKNK